MCFFVPNAEAVFHTRFSVAGYAWLILEWIAYHPTQRIIMYSFIFPYAVFATNV